MSSTIIIIAIVAGLAGYYYFFFKRGGGQGLMEREYGLDPGEEVKAAIGGHTIPETTVKDELGAAALSLLTGDEVKVVGRVFNLVVTAKNRVALRIERDNPIHLERGSFQVEVTGDLFKEAVFKEHGGPIKLRGRKGMEPAKIVHFSGDAIGEIDLALPGSEAESLVKWTETGVFA